MHTNFKSINTLRFSIDTNPTQWQHVMGVVLPRKKMMLLSQETRSEVHRYSSITFLSHSFVEHVRHLFSLPGISPFLSHRVTQDPLQKFFGLQQKRGRVNENPNAAEFFKITQALRVVQAFTESVRGNCRGYKDRDSNCAMDTKRELPSPLQTRT